MNNSINQHLIKGAAWSFIMRWGIKFIGLINIIILARLLTPQDFGVVAMASIVIGFLQSSVEFGSQQLLIRQRDATDDDINAAWTIKVIQGILVAGMLYLSAPYAASYFDDQRVYSIVHVLCISAVITGFCNIGMTLARKELDFKLDFRINVYTRLAGFVVTLTMVLYYRNYWGLVYGNVASACLEFIISYLMHPYRPRFSLKNISAYVQFSYSIIPIRIARFINQKIDSIVVGGIASASQLGFYNIASDLAKMITSEVAIPLGRGLYPGFANIAHQPDELSKVFLKVLSFTTFVVFPLGFGLASVSEELVYVLLGEQWAEVGIYLPWVSVGAVFYCLSVVMSTNILIVSGNEKTSAMVSWVNLLLLVPSLFIAGKLAGPYGVAIAMPMISMLFMMFSAFILSRTLPICMKDVGVVLWRPLVASATMVICVLTIRDSISYSEIAALFILFLVGAASYFGVSFLLWMSVNRPEGPERFIYSLVTKQAAN